MSKREICWLLPLCLLIAAAARADDDPSFDPQLAAKYGLKIPSGDGSLKPAPPWLREAEVVSHSQAAWKGYEFGLKPVPVTRIVRARSGHARVPMVDHQPIEKVAGIDAGSVKGVPLLSHVPHCAEAFRLAHEHGIRAIPYVHFMCIHTNYADQDVFYFEHPEILMKDAKGHWVHTGMDGTDRLHRFRTCANSPSYWKLSLAYVKKLMDQGADGVFIDNAGRRPPCHAPQFEKIRNPEFDPYVHEHLFPNASHDFAWKRFLEAVRARVKSYGDDRVVVLNSSIGDPWQSVADCAMWESFIFSWAWEGRRHTWSDVKGKAKANQWYLDAGRRIVALAFLDPKRHEMKPDSYWAYACARLVDFVLWANLGGTEAQPLYQARLGRGLGPYSDADRVAHRFLENGLIVLNDGPEDQEVRLAVPDTLVAKELLDLYEGKNRIPIESGAIRVRVPGKAARVFVGPPKT